MPHRANAEILIVDDDAVTRELLARVICGGGLKCEQVSSAEEAWKRMQAKAPSLLLLDYNMPDFDGAELLRRLRAERDPTLAHTPTIMLTGQSDERSEVICLEAGADDFVVKPINVSILRARIDTQLRLLYMRTQLEKQKQELEDWRRNLERDLEAARLTQQALIPQKPLQLPGWEIASCFRPVIQVGGDIFGWLRMRDGRVLFWIADATGHGASAALLTTLTKLLFHHGSAEETTPVAIMDAINADFRTIFGERTFMTAMCAALEPSSGEAVIVGAGHPPLLVARANQKPELIWSSAPPLGVADRSQFIETTVQIDPGDIFVLYTDGLFGGRRERSNRVTPQVLADCIDPTTPTMETLLMNLVKKGATPLGTGTAADDVAAIAVRRSIKK
jgi:sigma-B regulation protein RsbU (phosphoserine phosphatase)